MERETTKNGRGADTGRTAQKRNYQRELDKVIEGLEREGKRLRLLLHSCCAPCSSYVLEYLSRYFAITLFYFNPNIYPPQEYQERIGGAGAADPGDGVRRGAGNSGGISGRGV